MNKYYFLYKNAAGAWGDAKNPVFIAKHGYCRAIPIKEVEKLGYDFVADFVYDLNDRKEELRKVSMEWELI